MPASETLVKAIAVTAELTGTQMSAPAARVMADDLSRYPEPQVLGALTKCRRQLKGRLTIADVISRLDDGRPDAEEAWAIVARALGDEGVTLVTTAEMMQAFGVACGLQDDPVAARMAFKEAYGRLVAEARDQHRAAAWTASLGHDAGGREGPLLEAVEKGRLPAPYVSRLLPHLDGQVNARVQALIEQGEPVKRITERADNG